MVLVGIVRGSVVEHGGDAMVNAANSGGLGGGGVDAAVNAKGGPQLEHARRNLPVINSTGDRIAEGGVVVTTAGGFNCVHAVGPNFCQTPTEIGIAILHSAYADALRECSSRGWIDVGCCLLSAGIFRHTVPLDRIVRVALEEFRKSDVDVTLYCFTAEEYVAACRNQ